LPAVCAARIVAAKRTRLMTHRLSLTLALAAAICVVFMQTATAQDAGPTSPTEGEIVVEGRRTAEAVQAFVDNMALPTERNGQLARWDRRICPGVAGLRTRYAEFVIDRMAQRAFEVDLDVGEPGCRSNILIVLSPDPGAVARELVENNRALMGYFDERGRVSQGRTALQAFVDSTAPVRWWHVSNRITRDGEATGDNPRGGLSVSRLTGNASRLSRTGRQDFGVAFIVVDANALRAIDFDFNAMADYLAMVALAQLDPEADTSDFPTILNLFAPPGTVAPENRPRTATDWDIAYLRGLYDATRDARSAATQQGEIARTLAREVAPETDANPPQ
jgi:hypothetical protein